MLALLKITQGPDQGRSLSFGRQQKVTIGRATNCSICLQDAQAARQHCELVYEGERVTIADAGSGSGTWVNGARINGSQEVQPGDVIVVGQTHLTFQWSDTDQRPTEAWDSSKVRKS